MPNRIPPDIFSFIAVMVVSAVSGIVSIIHRISRGHTASFLWVIGELLAAVLAGYLASQTYPYLTDKLPEFVRPIVFVSICAYSGGRLMETAERVFYSKLPGGYQ